MDIIEIDDVILGSPCNVKRGLLVEKVGEERCERNSKTKLFFLLLFNVSLLLVCTLHVPLNFTYVTQGQR